MGEEVILLVIGGGIYVCYMEIGVVFGVLFLGCEDMMY